MRAFEVREYEMRVFHAIGDANPVIEFSSEVIELGPGGASVLDVKALAWELRELLKELAESELGRSLLKKYRVEVRQ